MTVAVFMFSLCGAMMLGMPSASAMSETLKSMTGSSSISRRASVPCFGAKSWAPPRLPVPPMDFQPEGTGPAKVQPTISCVTASREKLDAPCLRQKSQSQARGA